MKSNMVKVVPVISSRTRETTMLGEVPICVISPPSSEAKAIGIRKVDGDVSERRANWKAIGIMIASAPMFFTKADSTATTTTSRASCARTEERFGRVALDRELHDAAARDAGADEKRAADDDDDVVAEAGKGLVERHDADRERGEQRERGHEIVAQAAPHEGRHHQRDDGERQQLRQCEHETLGMACRKRTV